MSMRSGRLAGCKLAGAFCLVVSLAQAERVQITVLGTTDLHGHIYPIDYSTNRPTADGLARVATLIRNVRKETPHVLLVDSGDTIQGTPLVYCHNRLNNTPIDPMMLVMNALGFDAMAVGNHEYNFGPAVFDKARREARFPWLSANTLRTSDQQPAFPTHVIKEIAGVRVAILGLTTPGVPHWENTANYEGLRFDDPVDTVRRWVPQLRSKEKVDVVVVAMHMGLEENLATGIPTPGQVPGENRALAIVRSVPGIDVAFLGHTHRPVSGLTVGGAVLTQANCWGSHLSRVDLTLERPDAAVPWNVVARAAANLPVTLETVPDAEVLTLAQPYHDQAQAWLSQPLGHCAQSLSAAESRLRDTALLDLVHRVQLEVGRADVSMASSFTLDARLPQGTVTVREIAGIYIYENTLVVVELTGAQLKAALEHSARYFRPYEPGKTAAELIDPAIPGYNYDMAEGVDYTIDLTRPPGDRIVGLRFHGAPLEPTRRLRVAINNYRLNGGGGYSMYLGVPVLERSSTEIRNLIIEWVQQHPEIVTEPNNNWRLVTGPAPR